MILRARTCAAALVTVGLALYAESAHADAAGAPAPPICSVMLATSKAGVTLPANAPALIVVDQTYGPADPTLDASLVAGTTRTPLVAGTDSHGLSTLSLPSPSAGIGTYDVEVNASCPWMSDARDTVTPLTLTAPVPFPTSVGTLSVVPSDPPTGIDKVRLQPTDSMRAFLPAASLALLVNGAQRGSSVLVAASSTIELAVNTGDACVENGALHREKRVVKVTLEGAIAGVAESPASASIDIPIDCGAIKWTSGVDVDGTGSTIPPGTSGPRSNETVTYSSAPSDSGGCSTGGAGTPAGGRSIAAFALGGLALVAMRRITRRRARR